MSDCAHGFEPLLCEVRKRRMAQKKKDCLRGWVDGWVGGWVGGWVVGTS